MPNDEKSDQTDRIVYLLGDLLITELGRAGVSQPTIRKIVGCNMKRVNTIVKEIKKGGKQHDKE